MREAGALPPQIPEMTDLIHPQIMIYLAYRTSPINSKIIKKCKSELLQFKYLGCYSKLV
jgi:hypothetical protein